MTFLVVFDFLIVYLTGVGLLVLVGYSRCQAVVWPSCVLNVLTGGTLTETLCARVGRKAYKLDYPHTVWFLADKLLDRIFLFKEDRHCFNSYIRHFSTKSTHASRSPSDV